MDGLCGDDVGIGGGIIIYYYSTLLAIIIRADLVSHFNIFI